MTYLKPIKRLKRWFSFLYQYQFRDIEAQYKHDVRLFDIHIFINDKGKGCFKYDDVVYHGFSFFEPFYFINKQKDCYVNLVLEETKEDSEKDNIKDIEEKFVWFCKTLQMIYPDIIFIGGYRKFDNKVLFDFGYKLDDYEYSLMDFA